MSRLFSKNHKHYGADGRRYFITSHKRSDGLGGPTRTVWALYDDSGADGHVDERGVAVPFRVGTFKTHKAAAAHIGSTGKINDYPTYA